MDVLDSIIPILKPDLANVETGPVLHTEGPNELILEPYIPGLLISYALDQGDHYELIARRHCDAAEARPEELRSRAIANLQKILPPIERHGSGPAYMLVAGGNLESSLLLLNDVWDSQTGLITGTVVAAVPARDVMLFTSSESEAGVSSIEASIERLKSSPPDHPLTDMLFQRAGTTWVPFGMRPT